jgi:hypothetical protein
VIFKKKSELLTKTMSSGNCTDDPVEADPRQQHKIFFNSNSNDSYSIGSRQSQLSSERRLLDQAPRDLRLHNRLGSPIGSLSELDDRGLLEGGASVKTCYSSSSQRRNRRPLEMKKRSSRLLERGKEVTKTLDLNASSSLYFSCNQINSLPAPMIPNRYRFQQR